MSSKNEILNKIKGFLKTKHEMPEIKLNAIVYPDKIAKFIDMSKAVGGDAKLLDENIAINDLIKSLYPDAKTIASNLPEMTIATLNPDTASDPHELTGIDLTILQGEVGVAENGAIWIPQNVKHKVVYFISEYLVIILDRNKIVNNMHEAYDAIEFSSNFGIFISGPSKTADIEQALVIGAHGAKGLTVILK